MFNKIPKEEVLSFLRSVSVMSIAAVGNDLPVSSVVVFAVDNDLSFYFLTKKDTYKAKALFNNPKISLSVWEHNKLLIQASGNVQEVEHGSEYDKDLIMIQEASNQIKNFRWPIMNISKGEYVIFKIFTNWLRVLDLSGKRVKEEGDPFFNVELQR